MLKVIGIGHALGGDDFVGIKIVEELSKEVALEGVEFLVTMDPSDLLHMLEGAKSVIIVDAIVGCNPGNFSVYTPEEFKNRKTAISTHGFDVITSLEAAKKIGTNITENIRIVGICAKEFRILDDTISEELNIAIPKVKSTILELIRVLPK